MKTNMNKRVILMLLAVATIVLSSMAEETAVYSGNPVTTGKWESYVQISASAFSDLSPGDEIYVYTSNLLSGAQGSFKLPTGNWNGLTTDLGYFSISGDYSCTVDASMVTNIKTYGLVVAGQYYTIDKVVIKTSGSSGTTTETVIFDTQTVTGSWAAYALISADKFSSAVSGDKVKVYTSSVLSDAQGSFKVPTGNWDGLTTALAYFSITGDYSCTLDDDMLSNVKSYGLVVAGKNYTIEKVSIISNVTNIDTTSTSKEDSAAIIASEKLHPLCNSSSIFQARRIYAMMWYIYGKKVISCSMANVDWNIKEAENVYGWTGKYPAMACFDYIHFNYSAPLNQKSWAPNYSDDTVVNSWWHSGGIVSCMWHWNVPISEQYKSNFDKYTCSVNSSSNNTDFNAANVPISGTYENTIANRDLEIIANYLLVLQKDGIPVIWRPLHEASGNICQYSGGKAWFWWGNAGASAYKALWTYMYNFFKNKGVNNLIWVWTSNLNDNDWYPGDAYVDIIGRDIYGYTSSEAYQQFNSLQTAYPKKMISLSECGTNGSAINAKISDQWSSGAKWSFFMPWYDYNYNSGGNSTHEFAGSDWWNDAFSQPYVMTRDDMKALRVTTFNIPDGITNINKVESDKDDVYSVTGMLIRKGVTRADALNGLSKGIYIVNGRKVLVK